MPNDIIRGVGCTISLLHNRNLKADISIFLQSTRSPFLQCWEVMGNPINQLRLKHPSGGWLFNEGKLRLIEFSQGTYGTEFILFDSVPENFLYDANCGNSFSGTGVILYPYRQYMHYHLWYGCS
jgi:hypothetical protein